MKLYDLTHDLTDNMAVFPGDPECSIKDAHRYENGYFVSLISMGTHTGTHVDSPAHNIPGTKNLSDLGIKPFTAEKCTVLDATDHKGEIDAAFVREHLAEIEGCDGVIFKTGWHKKFDEGDAFFSGFPAFSEDVAAELKKHGVRILGTESPSVNPVRHLEVHHAILQEEVIIVEAVTNLDDLPKYFEFYALPLKLKDRDGSPVRAFAIER